MSALGQKQAYALQQAMSALHPIVTAKAKFRERPCPLCPQERTCAWQLRMSALGHKRTSARATVLLRKIKAPFGVALTLADMFHRKLILAFIAIFSAIV